MHDHLLRNGACWSGSGFDSIFWLLSLEDRTASRADLGAERLSRLRLCLHEWKMARGFLVSHEDEADYHSDPVNIV